MPDTAVLLAPPSDSPVDSPVDISVDSAVRRLVEEFRDRVGAQYVRSIVQLARADLSGVPVDAVPELVERLARHRLSTAA